MPKNTTIEDNDPSLQSFYFFFETEVDADFLQRKQPDLVRKPLLVNDAFLLV
ncbi:uncharacterized protein DS421_6g185110 [Arachis hypogaea]|nr:uncharacterized protein DS421_6g185110 [Arachis hypogaea]